MDSYYKRIGRSPLTMSDTNSDLDSLEVSMEKQNALAAEILKQDLETFYYACSQCPRILMSLTKLRAHEQAFHPIMAIKSSGSVYNSRFPQQRLARPAAHSNGSMPRLMKQNEPPYLQKEQGTAATVVVNKTLKKFKSPRRQSGSGGIAGPAGDYSCKHCHSTFTSPWNLKVHLQTIHENVRPFSCPTCGKSFKQRIHLLGHSISTHSTLKPFKCDLCSVRFAKKWNLFDHVRKHHKATNADLESLKYKYSKRRKSSEQEDD